MTSSPADTSARLKRPIRALCCALGLIFGLASPIGAQVPWPAEDPDGWGLAIIDLETTGLDPNHHELIDIGAIYTSLAGEVLGEFFVRVHPNYPNRAGEIARSINGFDEDRWQSLEALSPAEAAQAFVEFHQTFAGERRFVLTAYNAPFDRSFLEAFLKREGLRYSDFYTYFVLDLPSMAFGLGITSLVNDEVAEALGIVAETRDPLKHTGQSGARWNLAVYRALLQRRDELNR